MRECTYQAGHDPEVLVEVLSNAVRVLPVMTLRRLGTNRVAAAGPGRRCPQATTEACLGRDFAADTRRRILDVGEGRRDGMHRQGLGGGAYPGIRAEG